MVSKSWKIPEEIEILHNIYGKMLLYKINTYPFLGGGGEGGGYQELIFLQRCKVLAGSKVGDKYLTFLLQNTKYWKKVTFELRKVNVW